MRLSDRLKMTAALVTKGNIVADVGCDHGYSSVWLVREKIAPRCIAMDLREGPLAHAKESIAFFHQQERIETRLSDGLDELKPGEADTILICGMGGLLTVDILRRGIDCVRAAKELVLQPQSDLAEVRRFIYSIGWHIDAEDMCKEDGKYYPCMRAVPDEKGETVCEGPSGVDSCRGNVSEAESCPLSPAELEFGPILLETNHPVLNEWMAVEHAKLQRIKAGIEAENGEVPEHILELIKLYDSLSGRLSGEDRID